MALSLKFVPVLRNAFMLNSRTVAQNRLCPIRSYWRRRDSTSELSSAFQTMENYMKDVDKEMNRIFSDFQRLSPVKLARVSPFELTSAREIPVISTDKDGRSYRLELDMQGMKPEDINITLKENELTVRARCDEKRPDGSRFMRENSYQYTLPKEVNPDTIRSSLVDGLLVIEAPLPALESKEIPVKKIESGEQKASDSNTSKN